MSMASEGRAQEVQDINLQKDYGFISYDEYIHQTAEAVNVTPERLVEILRQKHVRNIELVEYVRHLKESGRCRVGILSNIGERAFEELFDDAASLFDAVILSYKEGMVKPNPEIFQLAAQRMGLAPDQCVMVDDLADNCAGAEITGMKSIQHTSNARTIESLHKLLQYEN